MYISVHIYIYIYVCVCVCAYTCIHGWALVQFDRILFDVQLFGPDGKSSSLASVPGIDALVAQIRAGAPATRSEPRSSPKASSSYAAERVQIPSI